MFLHQASITALDGKAFHEMILLEGWQHLACDATSNQNTTRGEALERKIARLRPVDRCKYLESLDRDQVIASYVSQDMR